MAEDPDPRGPEPSSAFPTGSVDAVEVYETDDGVVFYDTGNPLAWIESQAPVALSDAT